MHAFIFDFDGVIVDSELHWDTLSLGTYQQIVPSFTEDDNKNLKGRNAHDIYAMLVRDFQLTLSKEEFFAHLSTLTDRIYGELTAVFPGVPELIALLREKKIPMGIASSSERPWIERTLKRLDIEGIFDPIVTAADVGVGKPDPAVYLEAARRMGYEPADCCAIEDSFNGLSAAKAAGMVCIGLHHPGHATYVQDLSAADVEIHSMREVDGALLARLGF